MGEPVVGKLELLNQPPPQGQVTIELNGHTGDVLLGGNGQQGTVVLKNSGGKEIARLGHVASVSQKPGGPTSTQQPPPPPPGAGTLILKDASGEERISLRAVTGNVTAGGNGADGSLLLKDSTGRIRVWIDTSATDRQLWLRDEGERDVFVFNGETATLRLGAEGNGGNLVLVDTAGGQRVNLDSELGLLVLTNTSGQNTVELSGRNRELILRDHSGLDRIALMGLLGRIVIKDSSGNESITLDSIEGDIKLRNADCAEEFDVFGNPEPGTVLSLGRPGVLQPSATPYDTRVAGVVSGTSMRRPGIVLGRNAARKDRLPVALCGTVYCKVEAESGPIGPGTLLTTSSFPGHAMAVTDRDRAFGAVLGKALDGLERGYGLVPVLVALQ